MSRLQSVGLLGGLKRVWRELRAGVALPLVVSLLLVAVLFFWVPREWSEAWNLGEQKWLRPQVLVGLLALPLFVWIWRRSLTEMAWPQRGLVLLTRAAFWCTLLLALGRCTEETDSTRVCTVVLLDVSASISEDALEQAREQWVALWNARGEQDELSALVFAEEAVPLSFLHQPPAEWPSSASLRQLVGGEVSDVERALDVSQAFLKDNCLKRVLLQSDGLETRGHAEAALARLREAGVQVSTQFLGATELRDLALLDIRVPADVVVGQAFDVEVDLESHGSEGGVVQLYQGGLLAGLENQKQLEAFEGKKTLRFRNVVQVPGPVEFRAQLTPSGEDQVPGNHSASVRVEVAGPPRVLLVDSQFSQIHHLAQALSAQKFAVDVRSPQAFPASAQELAAFSFVIVSDVPRSAWSQQAESLLLSWVRAGGGFLFAGGEASYGPGGWQGSSLEKQLPLRSHQEKRRETPGVALSLVIDRSGSMSGEPMEMAKLACQATLDVLENQDLLEVIAFDSRPSRYVKMQPARYRAQMKRDIQRIQPGGGTELFSSLDMAYQDLLAVEARKKHIILLTDGQASSEGIADLVSTAFADGITVTTVGLGAGIQEDLLRMIAELGGGRLHRVSDPQQLPRIFTRETELLTPDTSSQDWFPVRAARSFSFFQGLSWESAPFLRGQNQVQLGPPPAEVLLVSDQGEPVLARQRLGAGWVLAWSSDWKARWAVDWLRWSRVGAFWGQLIRAHQDQKEETELPLRVELWGDELWVQMDAYDEGQRFDSSLVSTLFVHTQLESGEELRLPEIPLRLTAPGHYEARFRLPQPGAYVLRAEHQRRAGETGLVRVAQSRASVSYPYPEEYRSLSADPARMARWAESGGGVPQPDPAQFWEPFDARLRVQRERFAPFVAAAIVLFLLDLVFRRVRLPGRQLKS